MIFFVSNHDVLFDDEIQTATTDQILEYFKDQDEIQLDTETMGFDPYTKDLLTLQLGTRDHQFVIDATTVDVTIFKDLIEDRSKTILIHHAAFDLRFLYHKGIVPFGNIFDTFLAEAVISTGIKTHRKSLDACCRRYLKVSLPKEIRGVIHKRGIYDPEVIKYAANDVKYLQDIKEHQTRILSDKELIKTIDLDNLFVCVLAYMEYCGFGIDTEMWIIKSQQDIEVRDRYHHQLNSMVEEYQLIEFLTPPDLFNDQFTCQINWNSERQVIPLMESLGISCSAIDKKTGKEKKSIESKVLKPQKDKHPIVSLYLKYQKAQKLVSTYGLSFLEHVNPVTGRIHTNFTQIMSTGRLSSGGSGTVNLQNIPQLPDEKDRIPSKIYERQCFRPKDGYLFGVCDYSS